MNRTVHLLDLSGETNETQKILRTGLSFTHWARENMGEFFTEEAGPMTPKVGGLSAHPPLEERAQKRSTRECSPMMWVYIVDLFGDDA